MLAASGVADDGAAGAGQEYAYAMAGTYGSSVLYADSSSRPMSARSTEPVTYYRLHSQGGGQVLQAGVARQGADAAAGSPAGYGASQARPSSRGPAGTAAAGQIAQQQQLGLLSCHTKPGALPLHPFLATSGAGSWSWEEAATAAPPSGPGPFAVPDSEAAATACAAVGGAYSAFAYPRQARACEPVGAAAGSLGPSQPVAAASAAAAGAATGDQHYGIATTTQQQQQQQLHPADFNSSRAAARTAAGAAAAAASGTGGAAATAAQLREAPQQHTARGPHGHRATAAAAAAAAAAAPCASSGLSPRPLAGPMASLLGKLQPGGAAAGPDALGLAAAAGASTLGAGATGPGPAWQQAQQAASGPGTGTAAAVVGNAAVPSSSAGGTAAGGGGGGSRPMSCGGAAHPALRGAPSTGAGTGTGRVHPSSLSVGVEGQPVRVAGGSITGGPRTAAGNLVLQPQPPEGDAATAGSGGARLHRSSSTPSRDLTSTHLHGSSAGAAAAATQYLTFVRPVSASSAVHRHPQHVGPLGHRLVRPLSSVPGSEAASPLLSDDGDDDGYDHAGGCGDDYVTDQDGYVYRCRRHDRFSRPGSACASSSRPTSAPRSVVKVAADGAGRRLQAGPDPGAGAAAPRGTIGRLLSGAGVAAGGPPPGGALQPPAVGLTVRPYGAAAGGAGPKGRPTPTSGAVAGAPSLGSNGAGAPTYVPLKMPGPAVPPGPARHGAGPPSPMRARQASGGSVVASASALAMLAPAATADDATWQRKYLGLASANKRALAVMGRKVTGAQAPQQGQ